LVSKLVIKIFSCSVPLAYRTTIPETPKTVKDNFDILEECRGTGRKM